MADQDDSEVLAPLTLSSDEKRVLELHDRLQQLQLEIALLRARQSYGSDANHPSGDASIDAAQKALLESRSRYVLRNGVMDSVVAAKPILQAIHHGTKASPIERDLLPVLQQHADVSTLSARQALELRSLLDQIAEVESEGMRVSRANVDLASEMLGLAEEANRGRREPPADPAQAAEIERLEAEVRTARQRWRVLKGTASAVVAGSGVDWARDAGLRDMVLDPEEGDD
ncbi:centromere protein H (CENP-H)-domain-containing protein [Xylariomycetidae sp. FL2044]|nr:centromere protein H (CENP-H)-domain-containing protein [Xylariomycetidae sp. FL2044]